MPIFTYTIDYVGLNSHITKQHSGDNTTEYQINQEITLGEHLFLVTRNLNSNGPYGYSSWKQLRVSENPLTRHHKETNMMTFVLQPGPIRNVSTTGELRVRDRYSSLYNYTEPAVCEKTYPLVWNVGRHFKDEDGNLSPEPQRFSIISSYGNQQLGFSNEEVNKLLNFKVDETQTEYDAIKSMYLDNGLNKQDSPLTHWEFLQYRETIFPRAQNQYIDKVRNRPQFESFFRHNREDRTKIFQNSSSFGYLDNYSLHGKQYLLNESSWPLDEEQFFLTREYQSDSGSIGWQGIQSPFYLDAENEGTDSNRSVGPRRRVGEGILLSTKTQFMYDRLNLISYLTSSTISQTFTGSAYYDAFMNPGPLYSRRISLANSQSVSNPSGMEIYGTSSTNHLFQGGALWEAGSKRYIKDENGNYVHSPKYPFYDSYDHYIEEAKKYGKNYSVVPEFRMSTQVEDYVNTSGRIELDMFDVTGGVSGNEDSSKSSFFQIYSNTDFLRSFEIIDHDHKDFTNAKVLSLRCKAIKKFLPYEGFYPAQRTVDLAKRFYDSYKNNIAITNGNGVQLSNFNYGRQMVMTPLFAPGVLFNTIKSGVAVDYPIITGSLSNSTGSYPEYLINQDFNFRVPFEAIVSPDSYLKNITLTSNEPHPSGNLSASAIWDGDGDTLYKTMANNFFAEVPEFFLPNKSFTSIASKKQGDGIYLEAGKEYGMRISMNKSMDKTRIAVYHSGNLETKYFPPQDIIKTGSEAVRETFTMYSRPSAFGPPTAGLSGWAGSVDKTFRIENDPNRYRFAGTALKYIHQDSEYGFNYPFTPPYYHGQAWCDVTITGEGRTYTIKEIQESASYNYSRFDNTYLESSASLVDWVGPQSWRKINQNAVQLSASLNIKGIGSIVSRGSGGTAGNFIVDTALDTEARWIIQTKFETPMLNFAHVSGSDHLTLPNYGLESVPRGMWHQHGRIPEEQDGIFVGVGPIDPAYQSIVMGRTEELIDLSEKLGFSGVKTKLGRLATNKTIYEAVVAVPFIEENGRKKFFKLDSNKVAAYKKPEDSLIHQSLFTSSPDTQIGRSIVNQMDKMKKYIFPPSFDFINYDDVTPIAMYIFEFSHVLNQQDLSDIWQNLPPSIGETMEVAEVAITHPLLKKELLGEGGSSGNATIKMPEKLKWMVFKVKQRAASNYFKKTVLRNSQVNQDVESGNVTQDEFGQTSKIQYNWPYDYFSLVEMVKIDAEIELGNIDFSNYTDSIPQWDAAQADPDKIEYIVGGLEDAPIPDPQVPEIPSATQAGVAPLQGSQQAGLSQGELKRQQRMRKALTEGGAIFVSNQARFSGNLPDNLASSMIAQQTEDQLRSKYIGEAKRWVNSFNDGKERGRSDKTSNGTASRDAFVNNPEFAIEFRLANSMGQAIRTEQNLKMELLQFFRITG